MTQQTSSILDLSYGLRSGFSELRMKWEQKASSLVIARTKKKELKNMQDSRNRTNFDKVDTRNM